MKKPSTYLIDARGLQISKLFQIIRWFFSRVRMAVSNESIPDISSHLIIKNCQQALFSAEIENDIKDISDDIKTMITDTKKIKKLHPADTLKQSILQGAVRSLVPMLDVPIQEENCECIINLSEKELQSLRDNYNLITIDGDNELRYIENNIERINNNLEATEVMSNKLVKGISLAFTRHEGSLKTGFAEMRAGFTNANTKIDVGFAKLDTKLEEKTEEMHQDIKILLNSLKQG